MNYTILRTAIVYGPNDRFTTGIARILGLSPLFFLMPGDGSVQLQPLWVEDLVTCLTWALQDPDSERRTYDIGGPEYMSFRQIVELVMQTTGIRRILVGVPPPYLRGLTVSLESMFPKLPASVYWLDYMAVNRTTALDTMPRAFNLMPSRLSHRLVYLQNRNWRSSLIRALRERKS